MALSLLATTVLAAPRFTDVKFTDYFAQSVEWAVAQSITNGSGGTTFSPDTICTRAQIVTFLHRYFVTPLDNSALIAQLNNAAAPSTPSTPSAPADDMTLDPLPPESYKKQADWYMSLTRRDTMSNARLVAEYEQIEDVIDDFSARGIFITDSVYARENDLWSEISQRADIVERYDRGVRYDNLNERKIREYNELVSKYGDPEPLRGY